MVPELVKIGKLTRLHGIKGAVVLILDSGPGPDTRKAKSFLVNINGVPTPFFVSEIKMAGNNLILSFDTVTDTEAAKKLLGREVLLDSRFLKKEKKQAADLSGYRLVDAHKGDLGLIKEVVELPGQRLFALEINGKEVLLPVNDELIEKTDAKSRTVFYRAPEGLIDIYLE
jgi:16S rRNA processing protein RimM